MSRITSSSSSSSVSSSSPPSSPITAACSKSTSITTTTKTTNITTITTTETGDRDNKLQIFLGGSCNPTTWRQNVAIPYLETKGISYYNPQVDDWTPELVISERYAKQNAQIVLIVIDKQTRSTVSCVESAFIAGENKNLVLVVYPFEYNIVSLKDESKQTSNIIETRSTHMRTSRTLGQYQNESSSSFVKSASASSSTLVSSSLFSISSSSSNAHESDLCPAATISAGAAAATARSSTTTKTTMTSSQLSSKITTDDCESSDLRRLEASHEEAREALGTIRLSEEVISLNEFNELKQARYILKNLLAIQKIPMFPDILQALQYVSCCLNDSHQTSNCCLENSPQEDEANILPSTLNDESSLSNPNTNHHNFTSEGLTRGDNITDIYLSLDSDDHTNIEDTVIPILKEKGLTYNCMFVNSVMKSKSNPQVGVTMPNPSIDSRKSQDTTNELTATSSATVNSTSVNFDLEESTRLAIEKEICVIRSSRVLLFVITSKCRGLSIMVLASHFLALFRRNIVLCVQYLEEPCSIGDETLTKTAIADYNRGRVYLCDYAIKYQVPVFSTIREAIDCCSRKCGYNNKN